MADELPSEIDYPRLAAAGRTLRGTLAASRFTRVDGVVQVCGPTRVGLTLTAAAGGTVAAAGHFSTPVRAQCQRCLEWMERIIEGTFAVELHDAALNGRLAGGEDDDDHDFVEVSDGRLNVLELIEDELLLACPMIPAHATPTCAGEALGEAANGERHKPFAALGEMLAAQPRDKD
ncbi:MAG: YceD family protein [Gammaproteobacteria bacterium]